MTRTLNFRSVRILGAFNISRARAMWRDGVLKVFNLDGLILETPAERPLKLHGFLRTWIVETDKGPVTMKGRCMTCGGKKWWRITYASDSELWGAGT